MTSVKVIVETPGPQRHAMMLMGALMEQVRSVFDDSSWDGLRASHLRVLSSVSPDGLSVTELAGRVRMTKQGCGQFVNQLEAGGLVVGSVAADRRIRLVSRTARGEEVVRRFAEEMAVIEAAWAEGVGPERYAAFRAVLEELALS